MTAEPRLDWLLQEPGKVCQIGDEDLQGEPTKDGIEKYQDKHRLGSYRYVFRRAGQIISAIQVMSRDGEIGRVANTFTRPAFRERGLATQLLERAIEDFSHLVLSGDRSDLGERWARKMPDAFPDAQLYLEDRV